jgi:UDP-N-acetylmuramate--alanine ligase
VINGGIINAYGTNARLGQGDWMVVEADESDGTFVKLPATIAVVTNIDPEHMEFYGDEATLQAAFESFVENIPFYGLAVLCIDHPAVQALMGRIEDRRIVTYGMSPQADVRALAIEPCSGSMRFAVELTSRQHREVRRIEGLELPMPGRHNVQNALAAIAVAEELGIPEDKIIRGLAEFSGVKRRFTKTGEVNGITVIDDYGHHPVEISAVLQAARRSLEESAGPAQRGRVIAVVQPHRYSRLKGLFESFCTCFNDADQVIVADVYPAGEAPIEGADRDSLIAGLHAHGHRQVAALEAPEALASLIHAAARPGDLVICLGAGNITAWAAALPGELETLFAAERTAKGGIER